MNVQQLRAALAEMPDDLDVMVELTMFKKDAPEPRHSMVVTCAGALSDTSDVADAYCFRILATIR